MRPDTQLVVIDVPGFDEDCASDKYKQWVSNNWNTVDCAIVVMNGKLGVNKDAHIGLLEFVKTNLKEKRDIPVIILCNKIDDPRMRNKRSLSLKLGKRLRRLSKHRIESDH
jgi:GTPase Era involved in 16S rRNA processing